MRLDGHGYSPAVLQMIVAAGGRLSFADAAFAVSLAGVSISPRHVQHLTQWLGAELARARDVQAVAHRRRQLTPEVTPPTADEVAVTELDGGKLRTRAAGCGPGVHQQQNKEAKIACLLSQPSVRHTQDPQPEPPPSFQEPRRVQRLVQQMKGLSGEKPVADDEPAVATPSPPRQRVKPPKRNRTCLASLKNSRLFGPLLAAEAQRRGFYQASRRAFVADGQAYNWSIHKGYFADFEPIVDFLHVLCYLYLAAWAVGASEEQQWSLYLEWLRACWQGRVGEVQAVLACWHERLGKPPPECAANDPRRLVSEAVTYLGNNVARMAYPRYRQEGLPVTSSLVESLVGEFNARVKGREKFWNRPEGAEAILQVRAALLSDDDRLPRHFAQRPGSCYRRRKTG